jgi:putative spermidine/putrescine transport system substrate-binding protein
VGEAGFRRARWTIAAAVAALVGLAGCNRNADQLVVVGYGGAMREAQMAVLNAAWTKLGRPQPLWGQTVGDLAPVYAQVNARKVTWDVAAADAPSAIRACERGVLEPIDPARMAPGARGQRPELDFQPGAIQTCALGMQVWSEVVGYTCDGRRPEPRRLSDFFDLKRFPGRRALQRTPAGPLEWALLADGVPADRIYQVLATPAGLDRAFAKLDTIKSQIVWWDAGAQAAQLLADGEVAMSGAPAGRIFTARIRDGRPLCVLWDGQEQFADVWVLPRGGRRPAEALAFLRLATDPQVQARIAERIPYAPSRRSAVPLIGRSPTLGVDMLPLMPTAPQNQQDVIVIDARFWADHLSEILPRFTLWVEKAA